MDMKKEGRKKGRDEEEEEEGEEEKDTKRKDGILGKERATTGRKRYYIHDKEDTGIIYTYNIEQNVEIMF